MSRQTQLTQKELKARWGVSLRTVQRDVRRFKLPPADFIGIQPVFELADVVAMEERRQRERAKQMGLTVKGGKAIGRATRGGVK
jgi:hypothetical protein